MKYLLVVSWRGTDYEMHNKKTKFDDFDEAISEFNSACGANYNSVILTENDTKTIIRQLVKTPDGYILK